MRKPVCVSLILSMLVCLNVYGQSFSLRPYGIKSGIIEYEYSGDKTGKGTMYFDDYGAKSAVYTETVSRGVPVKGWVLTFGDYQYFWDSTKPETGMKMKNPMITWIKEASGEDIGSFTESMYLKMGMTASGTEQFLGKECKAVKGSLGKVLVWNGIMMMMDLKMGAYSSGQKATSIKTNIPVDGKYFLIPSDKKFSELPSF